MLRCAGVAALTHPSGDTEGQIYADARIGHFLESAAAEILGGTGLVGSASA